jgi:hypothetical protein
MYRNSELYYHHPHLFNGSRAIERVVDYYDRLIGDRALACIGQPVSLSLPPDKKTVNFNVALRGANLNGRNKLAASQFQGHRFETAAARRTDPEIHPPCI